jgi:transporter family-2 protein
MLIYTPLILLSGVFLVLQSVLMSRMEDKIKSSAIPPLVAQIFAGVTCLIGMLIVGNSLDLFADFFTSAQWWYVLPGIFGSLYLVVVVLLASKVGVTACVIAPLVGQVFFSGIVDIFGLFGISQKPPTLQMWLGIVLVCIGGVVANLEKKAQGEVASLQQPQINPTLRIVLLALGVGTGALLTIQGAINGTIVNEYGSPFFATVICCIFTFFALLIVTTAMREWKSLIILKDGLTSKIKSEKMPLWALFGGVFGGIYSAIAAFGNSVLPVSMVVVITLLGQIVFSVLTDHFGLFGVIKRKVTSRKIVGVAIVVVGIIFVSL